MFKRFIILSWLFAALGFASLRSENITKYWIVLPDSISNCERSQKLFSDTIMFQKQSYEISKKLQKLMEKLKDLKAMSDEIKQEIEKGKRYDFSKFGLYTERFDETGLIRGKVKYFIRIWKHPPKEKFNMPIFK